MLGHLTGLLLLLLAAFNVAQREDKYFADGGTLVMMVNATRSETNNILWKFNENLLVESVRGDTPLLDFFGKFANGRAKLNPDTADLNITKMTKAEEGLYTVELNGSPRASYTAKLISLIEQPPKVELRTLTCEKKSDLCRLSCHANTTAAEPVTFWWGFGEGKSEEMDMDITITKGKHAGVEFITCLVKNPLSEKESQPFHNPLYDPPNAGLIVGVVVVLVVLLALVGGVVFSWKKEIGPFKKKDPNTQPAEVVGLKKTDDPNAAP